jgi:hypothetical protein
LESILSTINGARLVIITVAVSSLMAHTSPGVGNRLRVRFVFVTVRP